MTGQKVDKRVARTKTRLKEGLADLMTEKSIQEITVKELVAHVHINRSTFYLHYSDISNMLENVKQELIEEIAEVMETYPPEPFSEQSVLFMKDIFFSLGRNRKLYRSLMGENGDPAFVQEVEDLVGEKCLTGLKRQFPNEMNVLKYSYRFCLSGCVAHPLLAPERSGGIGNAGRDGRYCIPLYYERDPRYAPKSPEITGGTKMQIETLKQAGAFIWNRSRKDLISATG